MCKNCRRCGKPHDQRGWNVCYYHHNKEKEKIRSQAWRIANPAKVKGQRILWLMRVLYNTTPHEVAETKRRQHSCCAICRQPFTKTPHIDHDHKTKKFRGLLCLQCNHGLGNFYDSPKTLRAAADYLDKELHR